MAPRTPPDATLRRGGAPAEPHSHLRIPPDEELPEELVRLADQSGFERMALRAKGLRAESFLRFLRYVHGLLDPREGQLTRAERELIAVVVSAENRCTLCLLGHTRLLAGLIGDEGRAMRLAINHREVALSPRERALADFAQRLTAAPAEVADADLQRLRDVGLDDEAIFEAIELAAVFNYTSRVAIATGSRVDDSYWTSRSDPSCTS